MTKLAKLLYEREMLQSDLIRKIEEKSGTKLDRAYLSRIVNGIQQNVTIKTAKLIAEALDVTINDII